MSKYALLEHKVGTLKVVILRNLSIEEIIFISRNDNSMHRKVYVNYNVIMYGESAGL